MSRSRRYYLLIGSLPVLTSPFAPSHRPISRIRLDGRLALLHPDDARELALIEGVVRWESLPMGQDDEVFLRRADEALAQLSRPNLRDVLRWRLAARTMLAALRRRHLGLALPAPPVRWGFGEWAAHIRRNWSHPQFRLAPYFPWIDEAQRALAEGDARALERLVVHAVWRHLEQAGAGHYFDFEAVVLYVLRWSLAARWAAYEPARASTRFGHLIESGLGRHALLFAQ
ncbi:MAG: DUF2764 family protein [Candidatus Lambdaproteobacteria bacterium]|nr:DUF2764 family protein [Candidatus Lambdaproteobacteria bacterium]